MAIVFLLAVNFPTIEAAKLARDIVDEHPPFVVSGTSLELSSYMEEYPSSAQQLARFELSVGLSGLGYQGFVGKVTDYEVTRAGELFYELLARFDDYFAAIVGWNPESTIYPPDLADDVTDGLIYQADGLVLANEIAEGWALDDRFVPFQSGYRWLPYAGDPAP